MTLWATIESLFTASRPTTVGGRIRTVVVNSIERQLRRWVSHVSIEIFKAVEPSVADRDAPSAVVFVGRNIRIENATLHCFPNAIGASSWFSVFPVSALAMLKSSVKFTAQASARFGRTAQIVGEEGAFFSAFTFAKIASVWITFDEGDYGQSSELLTCEINGFGHKLDYKFRSA